MEAVGKHMVPMRRALFLILFIAATRRALPAQDVPPAVTSHVKCATELPSYVHWYQQTRLPYGEPYVAANKRKQQLLENYARLKLEMPQHEVEDLLGKPDFGTARPPLHLATAPEPTDHRCSNDLAYIVRKNDGNMIDMEDVAVYLSFSRDGKLFWASPQNIPSLKQLGSPAGRDSSKP
jgi:hypothetical protein